MRSVLIVIFVFFYLLLGLPVLGAMWIIHKFAPAWADMAQLRLVQWAFSVIIFLSGADIEFIGEENVPKDEAVLYIGNHRSFFDIIITLLQMSTPDRLHLKAEHHKNTGAGSLDEAPALPVFGPR